MSIFIDFFRDVLNELLKPALTYLLHVNVLIFHFMKGRKGRFDSSCCNCNLLRFSLFIVKPFNDIIFFRLNFNQELWLCQCRSVCCNDLFDSSFKFSLNCCFSWTLFKFQRHSMIILCQYLMNFTCLRLSRKQNIVILH